jgi:Conserved TM helix
MNQTLNQAGLWLRQYGDDILIAALILVAAHFVAKMVKWAIAQAVDRIPFLSRRDSAGPGGERPIIDVGDRLGEVGYWVVWLIGLIAALDQLKLAFPGLAPIGAPLNTMVNGFIIHVPEVVAAALIFFIGYVLATIARRMVEAAAEAAEIDRRLVDAGLSHMPRGPGLARLLGMIVFALIIIPVSIQALDTLNITAISEPASRMLNNLLAAIPSVLGAAVIIVIAYVVGRWVANLVEQGLRSIGFDDIVGSIARAEPLTVPQAAPATPSAFPPSRMIGLAVLIGIILFASVEAARALQFTAMAGMLEDVVELATKLLFGAVIVALGVLLANLLASMVAKNASASSEILSVLVRWGVIVLATAVGLSFMDVADNIIALAFGLILGSVAVAAAIAFGIGGRDAAKRLLDRWTA